MKQIKYIIIIKNNNEEIMDVLSQGIFVQDIDSFREDIKKMIKCDKILILLK